MPFKKGWSRKEQGQFLYQLGQCLSEGYSLQVAIQLQFFHRRPLIQKNLQLMIAQLEEGRSFCDVLRLFTFPSEVACAVYFSEVSGHLAKGLMESGEMLCRREANKERLGRLLRYPLFLLWLLTGMLFIIGHFLLPNFLNLYQSLQIRLPFVTRLLLYLSSHTRWFLIFALLCILVIMSVLLGVKKVPVRRKIAIALRIPVIRDYLLHYLTHQFSFYLGSMLRSGLSIIQSLEALSNREVPSFLKEEAFRLKKALTEGNEIEEWIAREKCYLPELGSVIRQGELNGILGEVLYRYSQALLSRLERKTERLISCCQPAVLILVGGLVLCLFSAVLLPIFHIVNGL